MAAPTAAELALVNQVFTVADPQKLGIVTGDAALKIFAGTHLSSGVLGEIWAIADSDSNGFLTRKNTAIALRLIGHAQNGESISEALAHKSGPLATIDGVSSHVRPGSTPIPVSPKPTGALQRLPPFDPQDKAKFQRIFTGSGPVNGLLSGDKARDIFLKSKLPYEKLSQIWQLSDTQDRGSLDVTDFSVAMYFVQAAMSNPSLTLPTTLPSGLYEQAGGRPTAVVSHATGSNIGLPSSPLNSSFTASGGQQIKPQYTGGALNALKPQYTGQAAPTTGPFPNAVRPIVQQFWDVSPTEKATSDGFYKTLDTQNKGYIEGDVAVPFLLQSGLNEEILAQVWDLADIQKDGKLTQDTFAVAMHLINGKLASKPIPDRLPDSLIPPSLRQSAAKPAPAPVSEIQRDLFDLSSPPSPVRSGTSSSTFTPPLSNSILRPQTTGTRSPAPTAPIFPAPVTSAPSSPPPQIAQPPATFKDLLGDDDDSAAENATIHANAAEIGNLQNQLNSTQRSMKSTQEERKTLEETVSAQASQLSALQSQLTTAKAAYDTEKKLLETLQERLASQNTEIQKTREELIRAESTLSAVKVEKGEIEGSVLRDKEEIRGLQFRMKELTEAADLAKGETEKAKKEARQQKGLLAIAKKQLASSEVDKEKALKELEEAKEELEQARKEIAETEKHIAENTTATEATRADSANHRAMSPPPAEVAAQVHLPATPAIATPTSGTSVRSTNPFEKLVGASPSTPKSATPFQSFIPPEMSTETQAAAAPVSEDPFGSIDEPSGPQSQVDAQSLKQDEPVLVATDAAELKADHVGNGQVADKFPALDESSGSHKAPETEFEPVREIEPEESDSDSSDVEFHDAKVTSPISPVASQPSQAIANSVEDTTPTVPPGLSGHDPSIPPTASAFDDAFGTPAEEFNVPGAQIPAKVKEESGIKDEVPHAPLVEDGRPELAVSAPATEATPPVSGVSAFDEALGNKVGQPAAAKTGPPEFSFESNFDDTFDFGSSSTNKPAPAADQMNTPSTPFSIIPSIEKEPSVQATAPTSTFTPLPPIQTEGNGISFDDAFGNFGHDVPSAVNGAPKENGESGLSFDDTFGTSNTAVPARSAEATRSNTLDSSVEGASSLDDTTRASSPRPAPAITTSGSPNRTFSSTRSVSPPPRSPPIRPTSPRGGKLSGSSSRLTAPEEKRQHKLSIRFPFGRNKKDKESKEKDGKPKRHAPPPGTPPQAGHLLSPINDVGGEVSPAVEDDAEPLKALCQMGFGRSQALAALEANNFDMSRALNSLISAQ